MEKIGIVTVTYNSTAVLSPFLECIWLQSHQNFVLYIIDNASKDTTIQILEKEQDSRLQLIKNECNFGVAKANNQGIKKAIEDGCNQVLIINNDVEFEREMIEKLLKVQRDKNCSLVTPKMMFHDNKNLIWYAGSWFIKSKGFLPLHRGIGEIDTGQYDEIKKTEYAPTCCLLAKKEIFKDIGFMDEKYFVYFDDTDFSYRVFKNGKHKMYYVPNIKFYHKVGSLTKSFKTEDIKIYRGNFFLKQTTRNHIYFLKKIGGLYAYLFIFWLLFKNNISFVINPKIRKNFSTFWLINKAYFQGLFL
jgi:GT2 family glycosyltransferase